MKYKRILAILWHWDPLREKRLAFDTVSVEEDGESLVCRLQHNRSIGAIGKDMVRCAKMVNPGGKIMMMIHRESLNTGTHQELEGKIEKALPEGAAFDWKVFGGGGDYIYYDSKNDTGLLNQEGDFAINNIYKYQSKDNILLKRVAVVGALNSEGMPVLKKNYFDQVWRHYCFDFKKNVYELERDLFLHFAPFTDPGYDKKDCALAVHLAANEPLALRLSSFVELNIDEKKVAEHQLPLFEDCSEILKATYGQQAFETYEELRRAIYNVFLGGNENDTQPHLAIPAVRQQFIQLRSFMPEKITY